MIFDTDVMIWAFRGNDKALDAIDRAVMRSISAVTYMELLQGVRNKAEMLSMKRFLSTLGFSTLPVTPVPLPSWRRRRSKAILAYATRSSSQRRLKAEIGFSAATRNTSRKFHFLMPWLFA